jgi:rod shape-determining protein MreD
MRWIRLFLVLVALVVLQSAVFTELRIFGAVPDLLLVGAIAMGYDRGPQWGAAFGFVGGVSIDLFLTTPLGVSSLAFAVVGYAVGVFQSGLVRSSRQLPVVLGFAGGLAGGALFVLVASIAGEPGLLDGYSARVVLVAAVYDALAAPAVFPLVRWAAGERDRWEYR